MKPLRIRFFEDPETSEPHIYQHAVSEAEVEDVLRDPGVDRRARGESRIALGQTRDGRYLRVVYLRDPEPRSFLVVTAYDLRGKPLIAFKRRLRKKKTR